MGGCKVKCSSGGGPLTAGVWGSESGFLLLPLPQSTEQMEAIEGRCRGREGAGMIRSLPLKGLGTGEDPKRELAPCDRGAGSRRLHNRAQGCSCSASHLLSYHLRTRWETHQDPCKRPTSRPSGRRKLHAALRVRHGGSWSFSANVRHREGCVERTAQGF